jgi:adiponectin receptor
MFFSLNLFSVWYSITRNLNACSQDSDLMRHSSEQSVFHKQDGSGDGIPRWPWFVYLTGTMVCLVCSSLSHLLACHSNRYNLFFWRLDYAGISLVIVSSFLAPIYYTFYCNPNPRFFYLTSILVHLTLQGTAIRFFMCLLF